MKQRFSRLVPLVCALMFLLGGVAQAQVNFKPLERGDYTEVEEKLIILRGLEVSADFAFRIVKNNSDDLPFEQRGTNAFQDLRLNFKTLFHRDVGVHLNLDLGRGDFSDSNLRESQSDDRGRLADSQITQVNAREAYLRYKFNPNSDLLIGKHELSLGDRRGKMFNAIVPAITFDCEIGTWCFPFGMAKIGPESGDAIYHFGLQYTAWDSESNGFKDTLQVEVFRAIYSEGNIPLGKNLGPARFNPNDPRNQRPNDLDGGADPSQYLEVSAAAEPIYYDAPAQDYFGLRINYEGGNIFANFDAVGNRGSRKYHTFRDPVFGVTTNLAQPNSPQVFADIRGVAVETELGYRTETMRFGLRFMNASGDTFIATAGSNQTDFNRGLRGFYEITPGSYNGTRLYFNGADSEVDLGAGLGHSINNTRLIGIFFDVNRKSAGNVEYSLGLYSLRFNRPIPDTNGALQDEIGVELDNLLVWNVHKAIDFQFEINAIFPGKAFRVDDFSRPQPGQDNMIQSVFRVVYSF